MSFFFLNDSQNDKNYHADEEYGDDYDGHNMNFKYRATKYLFPILLEAKCQFISNYKIGINFKLFIILFIFSLILIKTYQNTGREQLEYLYMS